MSKIINLYRWNQYEGRSFDFSIDASQIESVRKIDARHGDAMVRTVSGDEFVVSNEYQFVVKRWHECRV